MQDKLLFTHSQFFLQQMRVDFNGHFKVGRDFAEEKYVGQREVRAVSIHGLEQGGVIDL